MEYKLSNIAKILSASEKAILNTAKEKRIPIKPFFSEEEFEKIKHRILYKRNHSQKRWRKLKKENPSENRPEKTKEELQVIKEKYKNGVTRLQIENWVDEMMYQIVNIL